MLQVTQVTRTQTTDYKNECQLCHGSKHLRVSASTFHIHQSTVALVIYYYLAGAGFCHWKEFWSNSGWLKWTRRTAVLYVPNGAERGLPPHSCESSHHVNGGEAAVWLCETGWIRRRPRGQSIRVHTRRCESRIIPMIQHDRRSHCAYVGLLLQLYSMWLYNVNAPFL